MGELQGAIMLVQLRRLPGILEDMRQRKAALKNAVDDVAKRKGIVFRKVNDATGDTAISLVFFAPTAERATKISAALNAEQVGTFVLYEPDRLDYHIYAHWAPVLNKQVWSERGGPWCWHHGTLDYSPKMCPRSLDLLSRAVHIDISPDMSMTHVEEYAEAITKVLSALL
jgi:dTDP-4-amino-4,6-dideoxygalactose transaminase